MSSVEYFRKFVIERLSAAAEEIFGVFEKTIFEYQEEIDRQSKLLDIVWKPVIKLHRIELPQQHVCKEEEEVLSDQQLCIQERNSSLDQDDADPPQIKEEQEELCTSQEGEQLELKQETETFMLTPSYEKSDHTEPEPTRDHQLLSNNSHVAESQDQKGSEHENSEFVNERLSAAAEEIFGVFQKTIFEYQEEVDRQSKLLDIVWKPVIKLHKIELPQQHVCKEEEEVLSDQQLCIQERNSSLDQEDPDPPQIKEEQEELCTSQEGEQLELKQETETFIWTTYEESNHGEDETQSMVGDKLLSYISVKSAVEPDPNNDRQVRNAEPKRDNVRNHTGQTSALNDHVQINTDENPYTCEICGNGFKWTWHLTLHMKKHTGEKPYLCRTCGIRFSDVSVLEEHMRLHRSEKTYTCETCGKNFRRNGNFKLHMRTHTGEKPYHCKFCGKRFSDMSALKGHVRIHTGEKPYTCKTCGKGFRQTSTLKSHMSIHTGEKPYTCKTCGKYFRLIGLLRLHIKRIHHGGKL